MSNFENFELEQLREGAGVHELANGLLPEMAEVYEVDLGDSPNSEALGQLVGAIGKNKVLQENIESARETLGTDQTGIEIAAEWLDRSGVQQPLDRSLWLPSQSISEDVNGIVITGAVANWQDRVAELLVDKKDELDVPVFIPVGNREMKSPTEVVNANVAAIYEAVGAYPTESQYVDSVIAPRLRDAGYEVEVMPFDTAKGEEIAEKFVQNYNYFLVNSRFAFARVANAGIQLAVQFRKALGDNISSYDTDPSSPQIYVLTDSFDIARTEEQLAEPAKYQNPFTGIRQVALTGKLLQETTEQL